MFELFVVVILIGAFIHLDKYPFGQFGMSQPIIAAPLMSLINSNNITSGVYIGLIAQSLSMYSLPIGHNIPFDFQTGGIVGASYVVLSREINIRFDKILTFIVPTIVLSGIIGGFLDRFIRNLIHQIINTNQINKKRVALSQFTALSIHFAKNLVFFSILLSPIFFIKNLLNSLIGINIKIIVAGSIGIAFASVLNLLWNKEKLKWLLGGIVLGIIAWVFLNI